jgi:NAD(P)-dependent dehydrogenase (short-subunit alcohol dehydrogenase family)
VDLFSLEGRVALVTGASRGIGRGIAEGLASAGARVVCAARTAEQLAEVVEAIEVGHGEAMAVDLDVADLESIDRAVEATLEAWGQIDILVNNAGINIREPFEDVKEEHYDRIMNVNLKGVYFMTQAVARHMVPRRQGKIIHIGSLTTKYALSNISVYASTKGAVGQLTKAQALEFAPHNIQVNAICPGFIVTSLAKGLWEDPEMQAWSGSRIPLGRLGTPHDVVGTAVYLASSASDYVTGETVYVDGGIMAGERWPLPPAGMARGGAGSPDPGGGESVR